MSAREIIAGVEIDRMLGASIVPGMSAADAILTALSDAGYRIVGPGELDGETLERAARTVERYSSFPPPTNRAAQYHITHCVKPNLAAALRSLNGGRDDG